jgi:hypothetical protein
MLLGLERIHWPEIVASPARLQGFLPDALHTCDSETNVALTFVSPRRHGCASHREIVESRVWLDGHHGELDARRLKGRSGKHHGATTPHNLSTFAKDQYPVVQLDRWTPENVDGMKAWQDPTLIARSF